MIFHRNLLIRLIRVRKVLFSDLGMDKDASNILETFQTEYDVDEFLNKLIYD
jgi:hypothetical protein